MHAHTLTHTLKHDSALYNRSCLKQNANQFYPRGTRTVCFSLFSRSKIFLDIWLVRWCMCTYVNIAVDMEYDLVHVCSLVLTIWLSRCRHYNRAKAWQCGCTNWNNVLNCFLNKHTNAHQNDNKCIEHALSASKCILKFGKHTFDNNAIVCAPFSFNGKQNKATRNTQLGQILLMNSFLESIQDPLITHTIFRLQSNRECFTRNAITQRLNVRFIFIFRLLTEKNVHNDYDIHRIHFPSAPNSWFQSKSINCADFQNVYLSCIVCAHTSKCAKKRNTIEIVSFVYIYHTHTRFSIANNNNTEFFSEIHSIIKYINTNNDTKRWTSQRLIWQ